ncbi:hypothetical protein NDU88_010448 [Pleurodeles waltl]|uniref:Uncharacterized protein n=1 Tax=Pleurodeles waltl TaxID=8319 RepID=A0AAV7QY24_PLEWA|nr:hypothetical protein NDU88_010448 [Pleurodeles waltl]
MQPLRFLRGSAGVQQQVGPEIRPCRRLPTQRRCTTPHSGAALLRSIMRTRVHHYRPGASSSTPAKIGTPPQAPAPLHSSYNARGLEQPGVSCPGSPPSRQHSNLHGLGEALEPARQARARREPSGCASRSLH